MGTVRSASVTHGLVLVAACVVVAAVAPWTAAQTNKPMPTPPTKPPTSENQPIGPNPRTQRQAATEMDVLLSTRETESSLERERRRLDDQLARDLQRLEEVESRQIASFASARSLDYKALAQVTGEVRDRAIRIKFNTPLLLKIKKPEKIEYEEDAGKLSELVPELSRQIKGFLDNPVFRVNSPNDSDLRSKAGLALEKIIKLSKVINRIAKRLSKGST